MPPSLLRQAGLDVLSQGLDLLESLAPADYTHPLPQAFHASIGGHFRHCLDHFECLLGAAGEAIDYDARQRDARIEQDLAFATAHTRQLLAAFEDLPDSRLSDEVHVRCQVSYRGGAAPLVASTFARELMYAIVHAVHHYALIAVMARLLELPPVPGFGVAPSTLQHQAGRVAN